MSLLDIKPIKQKAIRFLCIVTHGKWSLKSCYLQLENKFLELNLIKDMQDIYIENLGEIKGNWTKMKSIPCL